MATIVSTFDNDADGWSVQGDASIFGWTGSAGDPGGSLQWVDAAVGGGVYFNAPAKFLGNQGAFYGGEFSYSLSLQDFGNPFFSGAPLIEFIGAGLTIDYFGSGAPGVFPAWNVITIGLIEAGWVISGTSTPVTAAQMRAVLANITQVLIRAEFVVGDESGGLDNVAMSTPANQIPTAPVLSTATGNAVSVAEHAAGVFGTLSATDGDNDPITFSIVGTDSRFVVVGNELRVATSTSLDYERDGANPILLTVRAADNHGNFSDTQLSITIGDINPDNVTGTSSSETIFGGASNDTLDGGDGNDVLNGGAGNDSISGGNGNETIDGAGGNDTISGGTGSDSIDGGIGRDRMSGGASNDFYTVDDAGDVIIELAGEGTADTVNTALASLTIAANVERLNYTGSGNFVGIGNSGHNRFTGGLNDDRFVDILGGNDTVSGGNGSDSMDFRGSATGVILDFVTNIHGGAAAGDFYASLEKYFGSNTAADSMTGGGTGRFVFTGGGGNDTLTGGNNIDNLQGQAGDDSVSGLGGVDSIDGGAGNDTLAGGAAKDYFIYSAAGFGQDVITDFEDGLDKLKVHSSVANNISAFNITGNGTASVVLTQISSPTNTITLNAASAITITAADFVFY